MLPEMAPDNPDGMMTALGMLSLLALILKACQQMLHLELQLPVVVGSLGEQWTRLQIY
jgi:hypothetical protein